MQIQRIHVNNFKSLVQFDLELAKFNCLVGLNGAGKSTVLQFIDFLAQQMQGNISEWLKERGWKATELKSKLTKKKNIEFEVFADSGNPDIPCHWRAIFNPKELRCTSEEIAVPGAQLEVADGKYVIEPYGGSISQANGRKKSPIPFAYQGSILSQLLENQVAEELLEFKQFIWSIQSLDMLAPHFLRQRTRESTGSLGLGGQRLSAFLHELGSEKNQQLAERLKKVYPQFVDLHTRSMRSGWKQLEITEEYQSLLPRMTTEARHVNDGLLRLIAILAELYSEHRFLLFDEIENGINPELVEFVLDALTLTDKQVLVTTHSPMILNYLSDRVAKTGVIYLYKTPEGASKAIRFFTIPSLAEKLTVMGPGEAFVDTNLTALGDEIQGVMGTR